MEPDGAIALLSEELTPPDRLGGVPALGVIWWFWITFLFVAHFMVWWRSYK